MTTENATPEGVFESAHSARSNALSEIAKRVHQENAADLRGFNEDTGEIDRQPPSESLPPQTADAAQSAESDQPAASQPAPEANTPPQDDDTEVIVVNGREQRVKREQVIEAGRRTLQKESAADRRLEEASETLRRAHAYEQALLQGRPSSDAGMNPPPSSDAANGRGAAASDPATPNVRALVKQELWTERANAAAERFAQEYEDLAKDPMAARLVSQLENERLAKLAAEGRSPIDDDPWGAYKSHGETVRQWLGKAKPQGLPQVSADRAERKRDTVTVTGSTTRVPPPATPKPPTVVDTIEQMRLARRSGRPIQLSR